VNDICQAYESAILGEEKGEKQGNRILFVTKNTDKKREI
jgi:hypothetical protein